MVRIAWATLRRRPTNLIATFLALWCAVVTVAACGTLFESGLRYHGAVARYAAAPVLVASNQVSYVTGSGDNRETDSLPLAERAQLPASLAGTIAALPGVRAAVSDVAIPAALSTSAGSATVEAHPWSAAQLAPFTLRSGAAPTADDDVVLGAGVAARLHAVTGRDVTLQLPSGPRTFAVTGIAAPTGRSPQTATVFLDDAEATAAANHGTEVIGVLPRPGVSTSTLATQVRHVLPTVASGASYTDSAAPHVYTGANRGGVESTEVGNARAFVIAVSAASGGSLLGIALIVIAGTVSLSVRLRNRDLALLRAIAATPRQIRRMVIWETAAVSALAAGTGAWPGLAAAAWVRNQLVARRIVPVDFAMHGAGLPVLVAAVSVGLIAVAAAWVASQRPSRISASAAMAETAIERSRIGVIRTILGVLALAGGITLSFVSSTIAGDTVAAISVATVSALVSGVGLLGPLLVRVLSAVVGVLFPRCGVVGRLAAANVSSSSYRLAGVMTALVLVVALGGSLWFVQSSEQHVANQQASAGLLASDVVVPAGPGLSPQVVDTLRSTPGVRAATGVAQSTMLSKHDGGTNYTAEGIDLDGLSQTLNLGVTTGSLAGIRQPATVALDSVTAKSMGLRVGEDLRDWYGDGAPADLRVVAIYRRGLGFAEITMARSQLMQHTTSGLDDATYLALDNDRPQVTATVRQELARLAPGAALISASRYRVGLDQDLVQNNWSNRIITLALLTYVIIGALNTLIMYALGRRREFALLRLTGTTRRQIRRMVTLEQSVLLGMVLTIGAAIAAATLVPTVKGLTGSSSPYIPPPGWVAVIGGVIVVGIAATILPVRRVLRVRPIDAVGIRE
jgi:putative ABC transport system permease protein